MEQKFRQTVYQFKAFDPFKRYAYFSHTELMFSEVTLIYCFKGAILRIDCVYYIYAGVILNDLNEKKASIIRFKDGKKIVKEI